MLRTSINVNTTVCDELCQIVGPNQLILKLILSICELFVCR